MSRIYIPYATSEGQTARVAEYIADVVRDHGHKADAVELSEAESPLEYDGVIIGSSIHMGKHDKRAGKYVHEHLHALEGMASAFFSVSLAAHGEHEEAEGYVEEFEQETGWRPDRVGIFSGALLYTQYGFLKRRLMRKIASEKPGSLGTDISRDYVYTEWDGVRRFAEDFLGDVATGHED